MILVALTADYIVVRLARRRPAMRMAQATALARREDAWLHEMPAGLFLDLSHMWAEPEVSGCLRIGTDGFATTLMGRPDKVVLQVDGGTISRGAPLAVLAVGGRTLTLRSPVDGEFVEHNLAVVKRPEAIHDDPFHSGWLSRLRPRDGAADPKRMKTGDQAREWLGQELQRLRSFLISRLCQTETVGATMADGGPIAPGLGMKLDDASWRQLERAFYDRQCVDVADGTGTEEAGDKGSLS